jgi:dienelactone hydrolase
VRDARIPVDGQTVRGKLLRPDGDGPYPGLVFVHGWGASQRQDLGKARRLARHGFACLTFNLRGHARTKSQVETVSRADNLGDLVAAYDRLAAEDGLDRGRVGVVGASYGGYLATLLTAERQVRWIALQAPAIYQDGDFDRPKRQLNLDGQLPRYRQMRLGPGDNRVLACAARFTGDVLVVEAERDTVIPHPVIANYVAAFRRSAHSVTHRVIPEADHSLAEDRWRRAYGTMLVQWLVARAGAAPARGLTQAAS